MTKPPAAPKCWSMLRRSPLAKATRKCMVGASVADQASASRRPVGLPLARAVLPEAGSVGWDVMVLTQDEVGEIEQGLASAPIADPGPGVGADPVVERKTGPQQR